MDQLSVVRTGFAPVKGTRHLSYDVLRLDERGPVGDRGFALVELTDHPPARVLKTVQNPTLVAVRAELVGQRLDVVLPDGRAVSAEPVPTGRKVRGDYWGRSTPLELMAGPHAELFSAWLGRPVRLARAGRGEVVYGSPLTVIATASLRDLADRADAPGLAAPDQAARFRPTLVVETDDPFVEESWLGRTCAVGDAVIRIGAPIPRCAVIDLDPVTGDRGSRLLKTLVSYRPLNAAGEPAFGVFADVVTPGEVRARYR